MKYDDKRLIIASFLVGILLPAISVDLTILYLFASLVMLFGVLFSAVKKSGFWEVIGGKPIARIEGQTKAVAVLAGTMLVSSILGNIITIAWQSYV